MESTATPTSPQPASGNGVIAQPKKIRGVGFGDIFREGSVKLKVRLPSPETEEKKEKVSDTNCVCNTQKVIKVNSIEKHDHTSFVQNVAYLTVKNS